MRKYLEERQLGSKINTLAATDTRAEMQRAHAAAEQSLQSAKREQGGARSRARQLRSELVGRRQPATLRRRAEAERRARTAQQGAVASFAGRTPRRPGRDCPVARQSVGRLRAPVRPALHHARAGERCARSRSQRSRKREWICPCRRSGRDQVRHVSLFAIRHGGRPGPRHQPQRLLRPGGGPQPDWRGAGVAVARALLPRATVARSHRLA